MCRQRPLNRYERASLIVQNALHGRRVAVPTPSAVWAQRIYHNTIYRISYIVIMLVWMGLAIWEPPAEPIVSDAAVKAIHATDFMIIGVVVWDMVLQYWYYGPEFFKIGWVHIKALSLLAIFLNLCVSVSDPHKFVYIARILRPLLLMERLRNVRRVALNIASTLPKMLNVVILLAIHILFFSVLGFVLFAGVTGSDNCNVRRVVSPPSCSTFGSGNCTDYFASLENSAMQLFELVTATNFPQIALPAYECNPFSMLFFVAFIAVGIYLLINLTLAVTYATFKSLMAAEVLRKYTRMFTGFDLAFEELVCPSSDTMRAESFRRPPATRGPAVPLEAGITQANPLSSADANATGVASSPLYEDALAKFGLLREDFIKFFAVFRPGVPLKCAALFFDVFDSDRSGTIYRDEFRRLLLNFGRLNVRQNRGAVQMTAGPDASPRTVALSNVVAPQINGVDTPESQDEEVEVLDAVAAADLAAHRGSFVLTAPLREASVLHSMIRETSRVGRSSVPQVAGGTIEMSPLGTAGVITNAMRREEPRTAPLPKRPKLGAIQCLHHVVNSLAGGFSSASRIDGQGIMDWRSQTSPQSSPCRTRLAAIINGMFFTIFFDGVVLLNTLAVIVQLENEYDPTEGTTGVTPTAMAMKNLQYALLIIFVLEAVLKSIAFGPMKYWRMSSANKLDILLISAAVLGTALELSQVVSRQVSAVISFFRFVRLIRILRVIPGFGLTVAAFVDILPVLGQYACVLLCTLYSFALIGMTCFAGKLSANNPEVVASSYGQGDLYAINFDTLHGALVCNLYLLVVNDWPALMDGTVASVGKGAKVYYFVFWVAHLVLVLNVMVAFVIDSFTTQKLKRETLQLVHDGVVDVRFGVEDWRRLIIESGLDFTEFRFSKNWHHFDVYDELYKDEVRETFADTFALHRRPERPGFELSKPAE